MTDTPKDWMVDIVRRRRRRMRESALRWRVLKSEFILESAVFWRDAAARWEQRKGRRRE